MANAKKKKTTAKRAVKSAAKQATNAAVKTAKASQAEWAQQSAKLYQLPFAQGDVGEATKQAAATMQSATENMMRMGNDAMQQWWSAAQQTASNPEAVAEQAKAKVNDMFRTIPGFDPRAAEEAQAKMASFTRDSAEQLNKSAQQAGRTLNEAMDLTRQNAETLMEVTNIAATINKELAAEVVSYANRSFAQNVELSKQVLACRTLNDMFDLSSRFMKTNLDGFFSESVKLSEMMFRCATEVSEPLNERFSESSERLSRTLVA